MLDQKHTFTYQVLNSQVKDVSNHTVSISLDGDVSLDELLEKFHQYLLAVGYFPPENTILDFVPRD